eukprot:10303560-Ditylum_brightwellii.AAC.1
MNICADKLASIARSEITREHRKEEFDILLACSAHLFIKKQPVTRNIMREIRDVWSEVKLRKHTKKRFQWKKKDFDNIDWDESSKEFRKGDYYLKHFTTRYCYKRLPLKGENYSARSNWLCPCCGKENKSRSDFMQCSENKEQWMSLQEVLTQVYNKNKVEPVLRVMINASITDTTIEQIQKKHKNLNWTGYQKLIKQQDGIRWGQIRYGRFSKKWQKKQQ